MHCHSVGCVVHPIPHALGYAEFYSRSDDAVIRVYDAAGNVIEMHERKDELNKMVKASLTLYLPKSA